MCLKNFLNHPPLYFPANLIFLMNEIDKYSSIIPMYFKNCSYLKLKFWALQIKEVFFIWHLSDQCELEGGTIQLKQSFRRRKATDVYVKRSEFSTKHFQKISSLGAPSKRVSATI